MNARFIYLMEKYFDEQLSLSEKSEFENLLRSNPKFKNEFDEQKNVKEVLNKMKMKNPSKEVWDKYWLGIYNRIERGIAWIIISFGAAILIIYSSIKAVESFLGDTQTPWFVKLGIAAVVIGGLILFFSILREKIFTSKNDKYKEIQR